MTVYSDEEIKERGGHRIVSPFNHPGYKPVTPLENLHSNDQYSVEHRAGYLEKKADAFVNQCLKYDPCQHSSEIKRNLTDFFNIPRTNEDVLTGVLYKIYTHPKVTTIQEPGKNSNSMRVQYIGDGIKGEE